jgi:glycosyltransferase involved in cell wall biosynthesis
VNALYLLKHFPTLSQTFVLHEVEELTARGVEVHVVSAIDLGERIELDPVIASRVTTLKHGSLYRYGAPTDPAEDRALLRAVPRALATAEGRRLWERLGELEPHEGLRARRFFDALDVIELVRQRGIEHLHCDFAEENVGLASLVGRATGLPFTFKMRAYDIFSEARPELAAWAAEAARVFTISEYNRDFVCGRWGIPRERVTVCHDGVRLRELPPVSVYLHSPLRIVSVSRLVEKKGFPVLLQACRVLKARMPLRCDIYGDGPLRAELTRLAAQLGLQDVVTFHGSRPHLEVLSELETASVFVLACVEARNGDRDGTPNSLLEAMARGIPVVSTQLSGIPEIVRDGVDGLLAPPGDAEALTERITRIAQDRGLAESLRLAGQESVRTRFTIDRTVESFLRALPSTAGAASRR